MTLIPFLVVDRPASLRILSSLRLPPGQSKLGLMTHANTTDKFASLFSRFPCGEPDYCKLLHRRERHPEGRCVAGNAYASHFVTMGDSGVFTREGCQFSDYEALFKKYRSLGVNYGIIIDHLKDSERTIKSAEKAIKEYRRFRRRPFTLVGVAQGNSVKEYVECYESLKNLGFEHIAVGGLLRKKEKSKRFTHVRDEAEMYSVLRALRREHPRDWLFALGAYHPKRHNRLEALNIWGGDYKGWIFHYPKSTTGHPRRWLDHRRYRAVRNYIEQNVVMRITGEVGNRNLLVLGCSRAKLPSSELLPAIERYDGPVFRMVRKAFFDGLHLDVDIAILSGKYGLLPPNTMIADYDLRLTPGAPPPTASSVWRQDLLRQIDAHNYKDVFLSMGSDYLKALGDLHSGSRRTRIRQPKGRIGERLAQTKKWLLSKSNKASPCEVAIERAVRI